MTDAEKAAKAKEIDDALKTDAKTKADAKAKADAEIAAGGWTGEKINHLLTGLDSISRRLDALEGKEKAGDPTPLAADKFGVGPAPTATQPTHNQAPAPRMNLLSNTPANDRVKEREEEAKADAARADAQFRADVAATAWGERAPPPMSGETLAAYRLRLLQRHQRHSKDFAAADLSAIADAKAFEAIERQVYADSVAASAVPEHRPDGREVSRTHVDPVSGQRMTTFHGKGTFIGAMKQRSRRAKLNLPSGGQYAAVR